MAPGATPKNVIARLNVEIARALAQPEVKEKLLAQGLVAAPSTPEEWRAHTRGFRIT